MKILECSTKGDKRFSAFHAKVELLGKIESIENLYQTSKVVLIDNKRTTTSDCKLAKGKEIYGFVVGDKYFEPKYMTVFYQLLWIKYLDNHKDLVEYASSFDDFNDSFKSKKSYVNQADVIKQYIKDGRDSFFKNNMMKEFLLLFKQKNQVRYIDEDLLTSPMDIYGHQTNCMGYMGRGIALNIRNQYPSVYSEYKRICNKTKDKNKLLGRTLLLNDKGEIINHIEPYQSTKIIANIFGQNNISRYYKQTSEESVKKALIELKEYAKKHYLWIGIPFKMGCMNGGGNWNIISKMIEEIFVDYPICIYRYTN